MPTHRPPASLKPWLKGDPGVAAMWLVGLTQIDFCRLFWSIDSASHRPGFEKRHLSQALETISEAEGG